MSRMRQGFTLLEMSIVLVIIAIVMAGGAVTFSISMQQRQVDETNMKMAAIRQALLDYRRTFNRMPCPGNIKDYNTSETYFGIEAPTYSTCSGSPSASYSYVVSGSHRIHAGLVPTRTLKLPDDYAFDGWGRRFLYTVDGNYVKQDAFLINTDLTTDVSSGTERIIINDAGGYAKTNAAVYALLSFGANGHGAYSRYITKVEMMAEEAHHAQNQLTSTYQLASNEAFARFAPGGIATDWASSAVGVPSYILAGGFGVGGGSEGNGLETETLIPLSIRVESGSTDANELENCDCDSDASSGTFNNVFVQASTVPGGFDDILQFATRGDLASAIE